MTGSNIRKFFSFPDPVNEVSARLVAGGVVIMASLTIGLRLTWAVYLIAYGFLARALAGPKLSPLALLVTRVLTPLLGLAPRPVPGPPKRFAQVIGLLLAATASVFAGLGMWTAAAATLGLIVIAAVLESVFAYCLGCKAFALLMRRGWIPRELCDRCNNVLGPTEATAAR